MSKRSPFTLSFGKEPESYISRYENMETITDAFNTDVSNTYLIVGVRGCGKTVLMTMIEKEAMKSSEWVVVSLSSARDLIDDMAEKLINHKSKMKDVLSGGFNISVAGVGVGLGGSDSSISSMGTIETCLESFAKKKKRLLITIDEVVHDDHMRRFASEFQIWIRKGYPCYLIMTGLYDTVYGIQNDPALTFLLRSPKLKIQPLSITSIKRQYMKVFDIKEKEALVLANITKGYAFAFQALGEIYYTYRDKESLDDMIDRLDDMLEDFVYRKIWEGLSEQDKRVVIAVPENGTKTGDVMKKLSMTSSVFSKYRDRLIKKGILISPQYGYLEIALPRFHKIVMDIADERIF